MTAKLRVGDLVKCRDTGEPGKIVEFSGSIPVVRFDNGAVGLCTAAVPAGKK